jgi:hypothetical protein
MKKLLTILFMALTILSSKAQVHNSSFETINNKGNISYWGKVFLLPITIDDSSGNSADSFVYSDPRGFYFPTADAHTGQQALEMRNAFNYGTGDAFAGGANLSDNDSDYSGFGTSLVHVPSHINEFSFYYKYLPVNNDSAQASIEMFDSNFNEIGKALIVISGTVNNYQLAKARIQFTSAGEVAYVAIHFNSFYTLSPRSRKPSLDTRLVVDDVALANTVGIQGISSSDNVSLYPNPCKTSFSICSGEPVLSVKVMDMLGREISTPATPHVNEINASLLPSGNYIIQIITATAILAKKIIVE